MMVDVIRGFQYKTAGRGKGVLGLKDLGSSRRPGEKSSVEQRAAGDTGKHPAAAAEEGSDAQKRSGASGE